MAFNVTVYASKTVECDYPFFGVMKDEQSRNVTCPRCGSRFWFFNIAEDTAEFCCVRCDYMGWTKGSVTVLGLGMSIFEGIKEVEVTTSVPELNSLLSKGWRILWIGKTRDDRIIFVVGRSK